MEGRGRIHSGRILDVSHDRTGPCLEFSMRDHLIRRFNPSTQRTEEKADSLVIYPAREPDQLGARRSPGNQEKEYRNGGKADPVGARSRSKAQERFGQVLEGAEGVFRHRTLPSLLL